MGHKTGTAYDINPEEWGALEEAERSLFKPVETEQDMQEAVADIRANNKIETINKRISDGFERLNVLGQNALAETINDFLTPPKPEQYRGQANIATGGAMAPKVDEMLMMVESPPVPIPDAESKFIQPVAQIPNTDNVRV